MLRYRDVLIMNNDQLKEKLIQLKKDQIHSRFQKSSGQLEKPFRMREIGRDIARIKTRMNSNISENNS
ncbi:50S ribosomal protein L29 [Candidatus Liberibacter brunswickensis]|uniref:50S ribosomal protein L29 n=1 Tax=Candidatus Liberibacter brunswickensis TaxID=1968796 RepID=UPI002FE02B78